MAMVRKRIGITNSKSKCRPYQTRGEINYTRVAKRSALCFVFILLKII